MVHLDFIAVQTVLRPIKYSVSMIPTTGRLQIVRVKIPLPSSYTGFMEQHTSQCFKT